MQNKPTKKELFKIVSLLDEDVAVSKSILHEYREAIIVLIIKKHRKKYIYECLNKNGIKTSYSNLLMYLKRYPVSEEEKLKVSSELEEITKEKSKNVF